MTIEQIEKFIQRPPYNSGSQVKISFKTRAAVEGIFIQGTDYSELRGKNFWRIVTAKYMDNYTDAKDINFSRIFNGAEFTKISLK